VSRAEEFEQLRPLLFAIAYRILGSVAEAEDAVQETWLRYESSPTLPTSTKAFLSAVVTGPGDDGDPVVVGESTYHSSSPAARRRHNPRLPTLGAGKPRLVSGNGGARERPAPSRAPPSVAG